MTNKTLSIVAYITLIGWLIAFVVGKENANSLLKYHLRQSLGLTIVGFILNVIVYAGMAISSVFGLLGILGFVVFILTIIGIINAANEVEKPLPLIGKMFENKFSFIG